MATQVSVFSVLTTQVLVLVTMTGADLHIDVHPSTVVLGTTSSLDINCSFFLVDHPEFARFNSLILSKTNTSGQSIEDLAAITPDSVNVLTTEKVSATGVYSQTGGSYLQVTWEYPTATQAGVYQCVAHGLDMLGQTVEVVNASEVTSAQAGQNDIFEKLKQLENRMSDMENYERSLENRIQTLEYNNSQMVSYIAELEHTDASIRQIQLMNLTGTYQNRDYYVSRENFTNIKKSIDICKLIGGQLVEVDDKDEFLAIQGFLNSITGHPLIMFSGTDEASEGTWVLQSNNKPVPYLEWTDEQPNGGTGQNCLHFYFHDGAWKMADWACQQTYPKSSLQFMCEVEIPGTI